MLSRPSAASFRTGDEAPPKSFECSFSSSLALLHTVVVVSSSQLHSGVRSDPHHECTTSRAP
jgi:hypothetical protein